MKIAGWPGLCHPGCEREREFPCKFGSALICSTLINFFHRATMSPCPHRN